MKMTRKIPKKEGYYWFTNFGEHTPVILYVERNGNGFYASDEEFSFQIKSDREQLWSEKPIDLPIIDGKIIEPFSY